MDKTNASDTTNVPTESTEEKILYTQADIEVILGEESIGAGILTLSSTKITWQPTDNSKPSRTWGYRDVLMHAISSDTQYFPKPCIYCHLEGNEESEVLEMRLVPPKPEHLHDLFISMNKGAEMNPDIGGDSDEGEFFFNPNEIFGPGVEVIGGNGTGVGTEDMMANFFGVGDDGGAVPDQFMDVAGDEVADDDGDVGMS